MKHMLIVTVCALLVGCGMFAVKQKQCYSYCLEFDSPKAGEPVALCYGTIAELKAAKVSYHSRGIELKGEYNVK